MSPWFRSHRRFLRLRSPSPQKHKLNELRDARPPDEVEEENAWIAFKEAQAVSQPQKQLERGRRQEGRRGVSRALPSSHRSPPCALRRNSIVLVLRNICYRRAMDATFFLTCRWACARKNHVLRTAISTPRFPINSDFPKDIKADFTESRVGDLRKARYGLACLSCSRPKSYGNPF